MMILIAVQKKSMTFSSSKYFEKHLRAVKNVHIHESETFKMLKSSETIMFLRKNDKEKKVCVKESVCMCVSLCVCVRERERACECY